MLDVLAATPAARRIAVLGEMLELGDAAEQLHREVGRYAAERGIDRADRSARRSAPHGGGGASRPACPTAPRVFSKTPPRPASSRARIARAGDAVLFKGSRGVQRGTRAGESFSEVDVAMLYYLLYEQLYPLRRARFRVFRYITFRTAFASLTALFLCVVLGPWLIARCGSSRSASTSARKAPSRTRRRPARPPWAAC